MSTLPISKTTRLMTLPPARPEVSVLARARAPLLLSRDAIDTRLQDHYPPAEKRTFRGFRVDSAHPWDCALLRDPQTAFSGPLPQGRHASQGLTPPASSCHKYSFRRLPPLPDLAADEGANGHIFAFKFHENVPFQHLVARFPQ